MERRKKWMPQREEKTVSGEAKKGDREKTVSEST